MRDKARAREYFNKAYNMNKALFGEQHPSTIQSRDFIQKCDKASVAMPLMLRYDNFILAHPGGEELIKFTHQHYGMQAVDKILELGKDAEKTRQFWQDIQERSIVRAINRIIGIDKIRHPLLRFTHEITDSTQASSVSSASDHAAIMPILYQPSTDVAKEHDATTRVLKRETAKATSLGV
jgi:hypothetical protein